MIIVINERCDYNYYIKRKITMSVQPIQNQAPVAISPIKSLVDDCLLTIFCKVIKNDMASFGAVALVCRHWSNQIDRLEIGVLVFDLAGLVFPKSLTTSWQHQFKLSIGYFFDPKRKPDVTQVDYSSDIDVKKGGIAWIGDKGFIHFLNQHFRVCLFESPMQSTLSTTDFPIISFLTHEGCLIAGLSNGAITVCKMEDISPLLSYTMHQNGVEELFPFRQGLLSVSSDRVVLSDLKRKESSVVCQFDPPLAVEHHFSFFNHQLFLTRMQRKYVQGTPFFKSEFTTEALNLNQIEKGWVRVLQNPDAALFANNICGWGPFIGFFGGEGALYWSHSRINSEHDYEEQSPSLYCYFEEDERDPQPVFRGNALFVIKADVVELHSLRDNKSLVQHYEPASIAQNSKGPIGTVMGNRFIYFKEQEHKLVTLEFPIPLEEGLPEQPSKKRRYKPEQG